MLGDCRGNVTGSERAAHTTLRRGDSANGTAESFDFNRKGDPAVRHAFDGDRAPFETDEMVRDHSSSKSSELLAAVDGERITRITGDKTAKLPARHTKTRVNGETSCREILGELVADSRNRCIATVRFDFETDRHTAALLLERGQGVGDLTRVVDRIRCNQLCAKSDRTSRTVCSREILDDEPLD